MRSSGGDQHLQPQRFHLVHEQQMCVVMAVPAVLQAFFFDQCHGFVQAIEHGRRRGVMVAMRHGEIVGDQLQIEIPRAIGRLAGLQPLAARGETVIGDSPGGQLRPFCVQL